MTYRYKRNYVGAAHLRIKEAVRRENERERKRRLFYLIENEPPRNRIHLLMGDLTCPR